MLCISKHDYLELLKGRKYPDYRQNISMLNEQNYIIWQHNDICAGGIYQLSYILSEDRN